MDPTLVKANFLKFSNYYEYVWIVYFCIITNMCIYLISNNSGIKINKINLSIEIHIIVNNQPKKYS